MLSFEVDGVSRSIWLTFSIFGLFGTQPSPVQFVGGLKVDTSRHSKRRPMRAVYSQNQFEQMGIPVELTKCQWFGCVLKGVCHRLKEHCCYLNLCANGLDSPALWFWI